MYDITNSREIEVYGKKLEGKCLRELYNIDENKINKKNKGNLGQLVEIYHFGYDLNSSKEADFKEAGVEVKVVPLKIIGKKKNSKILREQKGFSVKERMVLSIIDYMSIYNETWETNTLFNKINKLLLSFYLYEQKVPVIDLIFKLVSLWQPSNVDLKIIKNDWNSIVGKIKDGKAHELSEGDTMYLGACTKGASANSTREQPFSNLPAKQRAFSFKRSYVDMIFEELLQQKTISSRIVKDEDDSFEDTINRLFKSYIGKNAFELAEILEINSEKPSKQFYSLLTNKMLKVENFNEIDEIKKANITIKTIRLKKNGIPKEDTSFPTFKFIEIIDENWEDSKLREILEESKFLFIVYSLIKSESEYAKMTTEERLKNTVFEKVKLWNMPMNDIETDAKKVWQDTKNIVKSGIEVEFKSGKVRNNFPDSSDTKCVHVRPHGANQQDVYPLPKDTNIIFKNLEKFNDSKYDYLRNNTFTKQCFWLNKKYIAEQLK